jgi:hypothetical protein
MIEWWQHLTPGQGTLLGGLAVLAAGILAFSTGWFERRSQQRRFHYEEVKERYSAALRLANEVSILLVLGARATGDEVKQRLERNIGQLAVVTGDIDLIGDYEIAQLLSKFLFQECIYGMESLRQGEPTKRDESRITSEEVLSRLRLALSRYVPYNSHHARALRRQLPLKSD